MDFVTALPGWSVLVALLLIAVTVIGLKGWNNTRNLPPGPVLVPFIGCIPKLVGSFTGSVCLDISKRFQTDIVSIRLAGQLVVILNSYEAIKEHFVKRTDITDRINKNILQIADPNHGGLVMSSGIFWKETRRFTLHMMRDFGMGRATADDIVSDESEKVIAHFAASEGKPLDPRAVINMAVSNIICQFAMGQRFAYDDQRFRDALDNLNAFVHTVSRPINIFTLRSRLGRLLNAGNLAKIHRHFDVFVKFVDRALEEHRERYDGRVNDMIDGYLQEIESGERDPKIFNDSQCRSLIIDLFAAGSETTHTTLRWLLLYMAVYQKVQDRVYEELVRVVGTDRPPNMNDRRLTPYTDAVINEVQRFSSVFELGLMHTCRDHDFNVGRYRLSKGTPVAGNIRAVHRDPAFWKYPERFDPRNFLDEQGKLINTERFIGFSIGRRSCAGESLARPELYIFFSSWLLKFSVALPPGHEPDLEPCAGIGVRQPRPYQLIFKRRE